MRQLMAFLLTFFVVTLLNPAYGAQPVALYDSLGNGITSTAGALNIAGSITATNPSVSSTGSAVPASATYLGAKNGANLVGLLVGQQNMANSLACVLPSDQSAIPVSESGAWNITNVSGTVSLPTGASTETTVAAINAKLGSLGQKAMTGSAPVVLASDQSAIPASQSGTWNITNVSGTVSLPTGASTETTLAAVNGKLGSLGQKAMTGSAPVVIASDQSAIPASESGTWNITNVSGTVSLPTGASTSAKQPALGTAGSASADVISVQGIASMTALKVDGSAVTQPISAVSLPLPAGASTSAAQTTAQTSLSSIVTSTANIPAKGQAAMSASTPVVIASDQTTVPTKAPVNANGSGSAASATVSTVITLTAPANAVGFVLQNLDTSTANIRWAIGRTATTLLGQQLQPGRDTGFVPAGANISLVSESGTQNYDVQWVSQ